MLPRNQVALQRVGTLLMSTVQVQHLWVLAASCIGVRFAASVPSLQRSCIDQTVSLVSSPRKATTYFWRENTAKRSCSADQVCTNTHLAVVLCTVFVLCDIACVVDYSRFPFSKYFTGSATSSLALLRFLAFCRRIWAGRRVHWSLERLENFCQ